jgi:hypothetical protein
MTATRTSKPTKAERKANAIARNAWALADGEEMNRLHPDTVHIAPRKIRESFGPVNTVKLIFAYAQPAPNGCEAERMWVLITAKAGDTYAGTLASQPTVSRGLRFGSIIQFRAEHIVDFYDPNGDHEKESAQRKAEAVARRKALATKPSLTVIEGGKAMQGASRLSGALLH